MWPKNYARIRPSSFIVVVFNPLPPEEKMAIIADVASIGTAVFVVLFSLWTLKELFSGK